MPSQPIRRRSLFGKRRNSSGNNVGANRSVIKRSLSLPPTLRQDPARSVMRVGSLDDSLHQEGITRRHTMACLSDERSDDRVRVKFDKVTVRDYVRTVGDNPSVSAGPPISLGWQYVENDEVTLDEFEKFRGKRRVMSEMVLSRQDRFTVLMQEWGIPRSELAGAVRTTVKVKNQRRQTIINMNTDHTTEALKEFGRKLKNMFGGKSKGLSDADIADIMAELKNAEALKETGSDVGDRNSDTESLAEETAFHRSNSRPASPIPASAAILAA